MNHEGRIAALEARYEHLATKADLERLGNRLIVWFIGIRLTSVATLARLIYFLSNS